MNCEYLISAYIIGLLVWEIIIISRMRMSKYCGWEGDDIFVQVITGGIFWPIACVLLGFFTVFSKLLDWVNGETNERKR